MASLITAEPGPITKEEDEAEDDKGFEELGEVGDEAPQLAIKAWFPRNIVLIISSSD